MRISDWSSDVCSSDLYAQAAAHTDGGDEALQAATQRMLARGRQSAWSFALSDDQTSSYAWLLGSTLRSNCSTLSALLARGGNDSDAELAMKLTRTITQARGARTHWSNTQENVFCTRALIDYADKFEAVPLKMTAQATLDAQPLGSVQLAAGRSAVIDKALDEIGRAHV